MPREYWIAYIINNFALLCVGIYVLRSSRERP